MRRILTTALFIVLFDSSSMSAQSPFVLHDSVNAGSPFFVVSADLDGDGDLDLASSDSLTSAINIFRNDGRGQFAITASLAAGTARYGIAADLDRDGDVDLAFASVDESYISVFHNDGAATFSVLRVPYGLSGALAVTAADVDGDVDLDLVVSASGSGGGVDSGVVILGNQGSGEFVQMSTFDVPGCEFPAAAADFDGDGDTDLAVPTHCSFGVTIYVNDGNGSFTASSRVDAGNYTAYALPADVDGDGDMDLVVPNRNDASSMHSTLTVLLNDGSGRFTRSESPAVSTDHPTYVAAADIDADGDVDLFAPGHEQEGGGTVAVLINNGSGSFHETYTIGTANSSAIALSDFTRDGSIDAAITQPVEGIIATWKNTAVTDVDRDGAPDAADNCPNTYNPDQRDTDGDRFGDACDQDDDNDGVADAADRCPATAPGAPVNTNGCTPGTPPTKAAGRKLIFVPGSNTSWSCDDRSGSAAQWYRLFDSLAGAVPEFGLSESDLFIFDYKGLWECPQAAGVESRPSYDADDTFDSIDPAGASSMDGDALKFLGWYLRLVHRYPRAEWDVISHSKGGVVVAYALKFSRDHGINLPALHSVITLDSPLQGAIIPGPFVPCGMGTACADDLKQDVMSPTNVTYSDVIRSINAPAEPGACWNLEGWAPEDAKGKDRSEIHRKIRSIGNRLDAIVSASDSCLQGSPYYVMSALCGGANHSCAFTDGGALMAITQWMREN